MGVGIMFYLTIVGSGSSEEKRLAETLPEQRILPPADNESAHQYLNRILKDTDVSTGFREELARNATLTKVLGFKLEQICYCVETSGVVSPELYFNSIWDESSHDSEWDATVYAWLTHNYVISA